LAAGKYKRKLTPERRAEINARARQRHQERRKDPEYVEARNARARAQSRAAREDPVRRAAIAAATRSRNLLKAHGMQEEDFDELCELQGGVCALCDGIPSGRGPNKFLHVDHDHTSGVLRMLLCSNCNTALGLMKDNPDLLRKAAEYLEIFA
jgi:hypothetical protein